MMGVQHKLTAKAQVTIPKDVRTALGVKPGDMVRFECDVHGRVTLSKGDTPVVETREQRRTRIRAALAAMTGVIDLGMSTDEYMRALRGDGEP
jgi:AbrB family looped-hinge helix DNA binding protein